MAGTLAGLRVIEMAGIGPGPFACMLLADMGAEIIRINRVSTDPKTEGNPSDIMGRGRRSISVNLKSAEGVEAVFKLVESADILIEGFRPGVMEKLGLGPTQCEQRNPGLIYGRMTGWGQEGPLSHSAGHDLNYIAVTGALDAIGRRDGGPAPPLNLIGDFGGGSMYLIMGLLAAVYERQHSGRGQVVDAAITDGVISLMAMHQAFAATGMTRLDQRQSNILDGGAPYYDTYECSDGKWISVGSIEPQFYALLVEKLGAAGSDLDEQKTWDKDAWPEPKEKIKSIIKTKTRDEWCELMEGTDVCFAPVLNTLEAVDYPHNKARGSFVMQDGIAQTAPAPRFSRTESSIGRSPVAPNADTDAVFNELGYSAEELAALKASGTVQ
jgi:alpha-methylacyl-CoA racemase